MPSATPQPDKSNAKTVIILIGVLVVCGTAVISYLLTQRPSSDVAAETPGSASESRLEIEGEKLAELENGLQGEVSTADDDPTVGTVAPTLTGFDFADTEQTSAPNGKAKAIFFVAHWCPHCQKEVPVVQKLIDEGFQPENLEILLVSTGEDSGRGNYPPSDWLAEENYTGPVIQDDANSSAFSAFGGTRFPYVVYLDGENKVTGRSGPMEEEVMKQAWENAAEAA